METTPFLADLNAWLTELRALVGDQETWLRSMLRPWNFIQFAVLLTLFGVAHFVRRASAPLGQWVERHAGRSQVLHRLARLALEYRRVIVLTVLLWLVILVMREVTLPSHSAALAVAAKLLTAWVVIALSTRLIRNRLLGRTVSIVVWSITALNILGILPVVVDALGGSSIMVGEKSISLLAIVNGLILAAVLIWLGLVLSRLVESRIAETEDLAPATRVLLGKLFRIAVLVAAIVIALDLTGIDLTALAIFSGAVGLGIGFGLQKVFSNLISGFILLMDKSIKPGDVISLGETFGWITRLNARYVSVITRDGREYLIPNEDLITNQVINWSYSDNNVRLEIDFGVAYSSDPHRVRALAVEAAAAVGRVLTDPKPVCHLTGFGDSSLDFLLRFWISDPADGIVNVRGLVLLALWDAFKLNGISIPYPHREVILRRAGEVATPEQA